MKLLTKACTIGTAVLAAGLLGAVPASAASSGTGNYGAFPHEGLYKTQCAPGTYHSVRSASGTFGGKAIYLNLWYSSSCGAYGELTGPGVTGDLTTRGSGCSVTTYRASGTAGSVTETVDGSDNFAYTKIVNDLSGRTAAARAYCGSDSNPTGISIHTGSY